jgi:hypothetical protein
MSTYYVGATNIGDILGQGNPRYFYALRRDEEGLLFFAKIDQLKDTSTLRINEPGFSSEDFVDFEYGIDFFEGRDADDRSRPYKNLKWDQYRWDNKNIFYYINDNGEFVVRVNQNFEYPLELTVTT